MTTVLTPWLCDMLHGNLSSLAIRLQVVLHSSAEKSEDGSFAVAPIGDGYGTGSWRRSRCRQAITAVCCVGPLEFLRHLLALLRPPVVLSMS